MNDETKDKNLGVRRVVRKGGSLTVTIPSEVTEFLNLEAGQDLAFIQDVKSHRIYLMKQQDLVDASKLLKLKKNLEGAATLLGRELTEAEIEKIIESLKIKKSS